jgi:predicted transcriptional regulator
MYYIVAMGTTVQPISFRPDNEEQVKELDEVAARLERSRGWVIKKAVQEFLNNQRQLAEIDAGLADSEAGRTHTISAVRKHFARKARNRTK